MMLTNSSVSSDLQECFHDLMSVRGALVVGFGNWKTGECLATDGIDSPDFPNSKISTAVTYNAEVIKAKMKAAEMLQFNDKIDDIMISLTSQWHIIKVLSAEGFFLYLALDRSKSNIADAGLKLMRNDRKLSAVMKR